LGLACQKNSGREEKAQRENEEVLHPPPRKRGRMKSRHCNWV
jgi:hypothetical protein